jgi:hypothetical protein
MNKYSKINLVMPKKQTEIESQEIINKSEKPIETKESVVDENTTLSQNQNSMNHVDLKKLKLDEDEDTMKNKKVMLIVVCVIAILAGSGTGFGAYKLRAKSNKQTSSTAPKGSNLQQVAGDVVKVGDVFGVEDENTFKDSAQGYLEKGGLDGEGSHKLVRAGGVSQTVYLTSSITDLDKFTGMEVKIWGETFKGQKVGWLMDVGRIEIINLQGESPTEE